MTHLSHKQGTVFSRISPIQIIFLLYLLECGQLLTPPGPALTDQLVTMGHPRSDHNQNQLQTSAQIHSLLDQSNNLSEKIDELLEQFEEQGKTLPRDFLEQ